VCFDKNGNVKTGPMAVQDIAGPLCFSGDFMAKQIMLPQMEAGDYVVVHETGGYTFSMYSKYNSRCVSAMYAYQKGASEHELFVLKHRETEEENLAFWGLKTMEPVQL